MSDLPQHTQELKQKQEKRIPTLEELEAKSERLKHQAELLRMTGEKEQKELELKSRLADAITEKQKLIKEEKERQARLEREFFEKDQALRKKSAYDDDALAQRLKLREEFRGGG